MNAAKAARQALEDMLSLSPAYAYEALSMLKLAEDPTCKTGWTDGRTLAYNPEYLMSLTPPQRRGFLAHEVCHCANKHFARRAGRDVKTWNQACDYEINALLIQDGFTLPDGFLAKPEYDGHSAESVYGMLIAANPPPPPKPQPAPKQKSQDTETGQDGATAQPEPGDGDHGDQDGQDGQDGTPGQPSEPGDQDPGNCGEVRDAPTGEEETLSDEWAQAVVNAATQAGTVSAGQKRAIVQAYSPDTSDLTAAMLAWTGQFSPLDFTWQRPNRRYLAHGFVLPTMHVETCGNIVVAVDTSGSINDTTLAVYVEAMQRVLDEIRPEALTVISIDTSVQATAEYHAGDEISRNGADYPGRGGTRFKPLFEALDRMDSPPVGLVILTDLEISDLRELPEPDYPTLWAVRDERARRPKAPYGETIYIPA